MLEKKRLGAELKRCRKTKNLTQKQLAFEICNQSEISRIEAGDFLPSIDILYLIANRLQLPITYFFEVLAHEEGEEAKVIRNKIGIFSLSKNYRELHQYVETLLKTKNLLHPETEKYLLWHKYVAEYYLKKIGADYCLTELFLLLRKKTAGMDILLDLQVKNSIANILAENKRFNESLEIYQEILSEQIKTNEAEKLRMKAFYNLGKLLFLRKEFQSALLYTDQGIDLSIKIADMSLLGQYYYQKGAIMEELSFSFEEIAATYKRSQFFLDIMDLGLYTQILKEKKAMFIS